MKEIFNRSPFWWTALLSVTGNTLLCLFLSKVDSIVLFFVLLLLQLITSIAFIMTDTSKRIGQGMLLGFAINFLIGFAVCTATINSH